MPLPLSPSRFPRPRVAPIAVATLAALTLRAAPALADAGDLPVVPLQPARELTPPPVREPAAPAPGAATPPARRAASGTTPFRIDPFGRDDGAVFVRADTIEGVADQHLEAAGKVELRTRRETVLADWLRYDFVEEEIWGKGNVLLRRGQDWIAGPEVRFQRDRESGFFRSPRYFISENGANGTAAELEFVGPGRYEATDARYTTCVAPREDWYIRMDELDVDKSRMVGTGRGATLFFLGAPIAYTPWLEFPLSGERKSGFLTPVLGSSGLRGFDAAMPYYLNLAPNYDATITPRVMTKRGLQLGGQFRYLQSAFEGAIEGEYLNNDRVTGTNRFAMAWKHNQNLGSVLPGLAGYWNMSKVSDNTYFADLADRVSFTSLTTLPREGGFTYFNGPWQAIARVQSFQTLQDPTLPPVTPPYNRLPQLYGALQDTDWLGLTFGGRAEYANFSRPEPPTGTRLYAYPTVAWQRQGAAWNFIARTGVHLRHYGLETAPGGDGSLDYAIPITSVEAGLVFERDWSILGHDYIQTLEPKAFYAYIPYRDQAAAPVFDTAIDDFGFTQLFTANRYLGNDRIGDANDLSLVLVSRLLDPTSGAERLRVAVGERIYFQSQRIALTEVPRSTGRSDFLLGAEGRLSDAWALTGLWQYNLDASQTERFNAGLRYTPAPGRALNGVYRYSRAAADTQGASELKQFDLSAQWPVGAHVTLLGRWNYSIFDSKTLEAVAGVEYNGDCWVLRLVGQRLTTTSETTSTSVYVQLELNGLARFGTSPLDLLRRSVSGYVKTNDPSVSPRDTGSGYFPEF
jgi:LPS-assembly protein